jgi:hypothetical protein
MQRFYSGPLKAEKPGQTGFTPISPEIRHLWLISG